MWRPAWEPLAIVSWRTAAQTCKVTDSRMMQWGQVVAANRELWTQVNAEYTEEHAIRAWAAEDITWGIFNLPEHALGVLGTVSGCDVVELGCGTAYFSAWLARRGARPV